MLDIITLIGVAAGIYLLSLFGPNEPDWAIYAAIALLMFCIAVAGVGIQYTIGYRPTAIGERDDGAI